MNQFIENLEQERSYKDLLREEKRQKARERIIAEEKSKRDHSGVSTKKQEIEKSTLIPKG